GKPCQLRRHLIETRGIPAGEPPLDRQVLALDVAELGEAANQAAVERICVDRFGLLPSAEESDAPDLCSRLRRSERRDAHENREREGPGSPHSITSTAWSRSSGGIVKPSAFAVFLLMTSSRTEGCSTGRSAGLVPSRIRAT